MMKASVNRLLVIGLGSVALWSGCATPPKRITQAPVNIPEVWAANATPDDVTGDWWKDFGGEPVVRLIEETLRENHDLKATAARLEAAIALARVAGADALPHLDARFDSQRRQQVFVGLPIPGMAGQPLKSLSTSHGLSLNLSWELDVWGRIRAGRSATLAEVESAESDLSAARLSLVGQTVKTWIALGETARQRDLARRTATNYAATVEQARARYERGIRSPLDLRLALSSEAAARALVVQREREFDAVLRQLEILLGRYPAAALSAAPDLPAMPAAIPAGLPSALLERRADVRAGERRLAATLQRTHEARAALYPRIALTASGGRTSSELDDLMSSQFNIWSLAGNVVQPLFQGGRLRGNVRLAEARAREAAASYASLVLRALGEVEKALAAESLLATREAALAEAASQSEAARRLAEDRYRGGLENFVTVLEAQRRSLETESQWIAARRLRLENRVDLHLALGGGFDPEPAPLAMGRN